MITEGRGVDEMRDKDDEEAGMEVSEQPFVDLKLMNIN